MEPQVIDFLQQSNYIESECSNSALDDAVKAWKFLIEKKRLSLEYVLETHKILMQTRDIPEKD